MGEFSPIRPIEGVWGEPISFAYKPKYEMPRQTPENVKKVGVCLWCFPHALLGLHMGKNKEYMDRICGPHVNKMLNQYEATKSAEGK